MNEKIKYSIVGFLCGVFAFWLLSRYTFSGIGSDKEFNQTIDSTKQQLSEHNSTAKDTNSRIANYNQQLEFGCRELDDCLREADRRLQKAIEIRTQETEHKQIKS